jgi:hypothetical protein
MRTEERGTEVEGEGCQGRGLLFWLKYFFFLNIVSYDNYIGCRGRASRVGKSQLTIKIRTLGRCSCCHQDFFTRTQNTKL